MVEQVRRRIRVVGALALLVVLITGSVQALPAAHAGHAQQGGNWECVVVNGNVVFDIRSGVGVEFAVIHQLRPGERAEADFGLTANANGYIWVYMRLTDGRLGWGMLQQLSRCAAAPQISPSATPPVVPVDGNTLVTLGVNDDGVLDRYEIDAIARSVVLVANVRGNRIIETGTGTIISPDGLIVTNAHVVEGADQVAIGLLDDTNDPPEFRYLGEVIGYDAEIDVALIAIRTDTQGRYVNPDDLDLPYLSYTLDPDAVYRGDPVWIFGFPGIGNDYLIVTNGSIVSVENGDMFGQRVPVWYRTDAEIAPGNSGGLAVDGNGQFLGIPTFVEAEGVTGGRLGGIRPAQVALMAVADKLPADGGALVTGPDAQTDLPVTVDSPRIQLQHGVVRNNETGIAFRVEFSLSGWRDLPATLVARVYHDNLATDPLLYPGGPALYHDASGAVRVETNLVPCCVHTDYVGAAAIEVFFPYSAFGFADLGTYPLKVQFAVEAGDGSWFRTLGWEFITVTVG